MILTAVQWEAVSQGIVGNHAGMSFTISPGEVADEPVLIVAVIDPETENATIAVYVVVTNSVKAATATQIR